MKRKAMALALGMALVTAFMPAYADGTEEPESQTSAPVQAPAPETPKEAAPTPVPATEKPTAAPTQAPTPAPTPEPFTAKVKIELENEDQIYFGDKVVLRADVKQANADYTVRWEYYNVNADIEHGENPWVFVCKEEKYEFIVNEGNAGLIYRLLLNGEVFVEKYQLPAVKARPEEPAEPDEEPAEPEETPEPDEETAEPDEETAEPDEETAEPEATEEPTEVPNAPEATEEPAKPEAPEASAAPEQTGEPAASLEDELDPNRSIEIRAEWEGDELHFGDEITLIAELSGYDGAEYSIQWETSKDEAVWTAVEGAVGESYAMTVTEDNYLDFWRVIVTVTSITAE